MATNKWTVFAVQWSAKYFFTPNSLTFRKIRRVEEDGENRQMQSILIFKQAQQGVPRATRLVL